MQWIFGETAKTAKEIEREEKERLTKKKKKSASGTLSHVTYKFQNKCASDTVGLVAGELKNEEKRSKICIGNIESCHM